MPKGGLVDKIISAITKSVGSKSKAIAIAKSKGLIKQAGKHLVSGKKK